MIKKIAPNRKANQTRAKKIASLLALSTLGISATMVASIIIAYDSFFSRYERPDYAVYPGMYCYARYEGTLPRQTLKIPAEDGKLAAYYYPISDPKGLVVVVHGIHAGADDYLPLIEALTQGGYAVFSYDATGNYSSGGKNGVGMCQQLKDLDTVLNYLKKSPKYASYPKLLIGHSWGGYAAASALALHPEVRACVCLAPMCDGTTIMLEKGEEYVDKLAYSAAPVFNAYQKHLFGDYTNYNGVVGINSTTAPVLIAQGKNDTVITADRHSITAYLDEIKNPNVEVYYKEGLQGTHTGIWHSEESAKYVAEIKKQLKDLEEKKGEPLTKAEKVAFYKNIDHRLYSEVNHELMERIFQTYEKGLSAQK